MIKRIVLTGGPCAGKTTVLSKIEEDLRSKGYKVFVVKESATELINGGITPFEDGLGMYNFQKIIMMYQYQKEEVYNKAVMESLDDNIVIIYDRGLLDNKSYVDDLQFKLILEDLSLSLGRQIDEFDIANRYDMVIHLVTSAGRKGYSLENNKARYESESEAILLDRKTLDSWTIHNNLKVVDSTDNFDDKIDMVLSLIHNCLMDNVKKKIKYVKEKQ